MKKLFLLTLLAAAGAAGQIPTPQVPVTGTIGAAGNFSLLLSGSFAMTADADYTVTWPNTSCIVCKVTSNVPLTATRNVIEPSIGMTFNVTNATTGGQSIVVKASSGAGVTIANGTSKWVWFNGTDYVDIDPSGINQLTGDVTTPSGSGSQPATLATVNPDVGTFGDSTHTITATVNGKGLITAVSVNAIPNVSTRVPHDETALRNFNTVYQNTSGAEMWVTGWALTGGSSTASLSALVGSTSPGVAFVWGQDFTATLSGGKAGFTFVVPDGYFYELQTSGAILGTTAANWVEYF